VTGEDGESSRRDRRLLLRPLNVSVKNGLVEVADAF
jgi:hypothetical protein